MFISPINVANYAHSRQNFKANNYQTNLSRSCKSDSVSFGAAIPTAVQDALLPKLDEIAELALSALRLERGENFSPSQTTAFEALHKKIMGIIQPYIKPGEVSESEKVFPYLSYNPSNERLKLNFSQGNLNVTGNYYLTFVKGKLSQFAREITDNFTQSKSGKLNDFSYKDGNYEVISVVSYRPR